MDGRTNTQNFGRYNIIPSHFFVTGHKNYQIFKVARHISEWCKMTTLQDSKDLILVLVQILEHKMV